MTDTEIVPGVLVDDVALSLDELARTCSVPPGWIVERVEAGLVTCSSESPGEWRFTSAALVRVRRLVYLERDLDANQEVAALLADLIEEVQELRRRLGVTAGPA